VVVTGCGIVTALGYGWRANVDGFRTGKRGFKPVSLFDVARQRTQVAAEADCPEPPQGMRLNGKRWNRTDRATRLLLAAAHEAWDQCGWDGTGYLPVILATTSAGMALGESYYHHVIDPVAGPQHQAARILNYQAQRQVVDLLDSLGVAGSVTIIANACASGSNAIGHAWESIRHGHAQQVLTGGYDGLCQLVFAGFDSLQALSTTQCRPFDADRDGLALGEGAAVLTLESLEFAQARGARILGEIIGYGASTDTHHLTQPHPEGAAALTSMQEAMRVAGLSPCDVQYVNAHGTGTVLNDSAEAAAINRWAGDHASRLQVSSTKGSVGHLLGGAGAVEAAVCLMALNGQWLPPSVATRQVDPACRFQYVTQPIPGSLEVALSNSFGFGGANASLVLRRWQ
jgi:3-oxoacyl-[acyl-carrier-protein] synthase II